MKIKVIGCGNAFSNKNFNQCFLLEEGKRKMLIDCGFQVPAALNYHGINIKDIDDIYISHAHADHVGGLEYVAFMRYDWSTYPRKYNEGNYAPNLIANSELLSSIWEKSLRGGLESMEGFVANMSTYFCPIPVEDNKPFHWQGWTCNLIQQIHIMSGGMIAWTFGLFMEKTGSPTLYFTTDSQHCSPRQMEIFYRKADIIFQDCEVLGCDTVGKTVSFMSGVHANFSQLAGWDCANAVRLSSDIKAKMLLSHYQDCVSFNKDFVGNTCNWDEYTKAEGFKGIVHLGEEFTV